MRWKGLVIRSRLLSPSTCAASVEPLQNGQEPIFETTTSQLQLFTAEPLAGAVGLLARPLADAQVPPLGWRDYLDGSARR